MTTCCIQTNNCHVLNNMVILEIYSKCIKTKYKSRLFSKATVFILITHFISIIVPFILAYRSRGFWLKHDIFYEQPDVRFKGEYLFIGITNNITNPIVCNNFPYYQEHNSFDTCNKIKVREIDVNFDGKIDELHAQLYVNRPKETQILFIDFILSLDYKLHTVCPLQMQSAIILQENIRSYISGLRLTANLDLSQTYPLSCHVREKDNYYNYSLIEDEQNVDDYKMEKIIDKYLKRNLTTHLKNIYTSYITDSTDKLKLDLHISYPQQRVYYRPRFWQIIKSAWIQYFAIYVIVAWVMTKVKNYVFNNNLILYYECSPLKKEQ